MWLLLLFILVIGLVARMIVQRFTRSRRRLPEEDPLGHRLAEVERAVQRLHSRLDVIEARIASGSIAFDVAVPALTGPHAESFTAPPAVIPPRPAVVPAPDEQSVGPQVEADTQPSQTGKQAVAASAFDWESMVGSNWLNKAGVLAFVIGLSLFLGYSMRTMGPAGRVAIGWTVSVVMMAAGVWLERKSEYRLFGRGFLAGGWAAAYFTTYAMYALPAAQVIDSPIVASALLLAVAGAIVAHSLRYQSQAITALTYSIAFATLNVAPMRTFMLIASWPLCASLLAIAWRYRWHTLSLAGVAATYGSTFARMATSSGGTLEQLWALQGLLAMTWVLFEGFDLLSMHEKRASTTTAAIFPLNGVAALALSMLTWSRYPDAAFYVEAIAGAVFTASAWLRSRLARRDGQADDALLAPGGFALPTIFAAVMFASALVRRYAGIPLALSLALEAELLLLLALRVRGPALLWLAGPMHLLAFVAALAMIDPYRATVVFAGRLWHPWTPACLGLIALHYGNARLVSARSPLVGVNASLSAGSVLVVLALAGEIAQPFVGVGVLAAALLALGASIRSRLAEWRFQSYGLALISFLLLLQILDRRDYSNDWLALWIATALGAALTAVASLAKSRGSTDERDLAAGSLAAMTTALGAAALLRSLPPVWVALAWIAVGAVVHQIAERWRPLAAWLGGALIAGAIARLITVNLMLDDAAATVVVRVVNVALPCAVLYVISARSKATMASTAFNVSSSALLSLLLLTELPTRLVTPGWGLEGLALVGLGLLTRSVVMRRSGLILLILSACKLVTYDARTFDTPARILSFMLLGVALIAGSWFYTRFSRPADGAG